MEVTLWSILLLIGIFKNKIAPIQINYLGYPGTIGADYFDYIIADHILIPQDQKKFYSEKIIYMPNSYQPNDNEIIIPELNTTKSDHGLPNDGVVFCCFNQNYKIGISEFTLVSRKNGIMEFTLILVKNP